MRARDGSLIEVVPCWTAEAERYDGDLAYASAIAPTVEAAWEAVLADVRENRAHTTTRVRLLRA